MDLSSLVGQAFAECAREGEGVVAASRSLGYKVNPAVGGVEPPFRQSGRVAEALGGVRQKVVAISNQRVLVFDGTLSTGRAKKLLVAVETSHVRQALAGEVGWKLGKEVRTVQWVAIDLGTEGALVVQGVPNATDEFAALRAAVIRLS